MVTYAVIAFLPVVLAIAWVMFRKTIAEKSSAAREDEALRRSAKALVDRLDPAEVPCPSTPVALAAALERVAGELSLAFARLADERDRLEGILETMMEGVLVTDGAGRIVLANRALRALTSTSQSVIGKRPIEVIRNGDLAELLARVLVEGSPQGEEIDLGGLDVRRVRVRAAPLRQPEARGVVAVLYDVTELRRLEGMRRDFVANVSHELRTPIAAIRAAAETLEGGAIHDQHASVEFVDVICRHAARLHELVEDLLDLSRLDARRLELSWEHIAVVVAYDDAVSLHALAAERRGIHLSTLLPDAALHVYADRRALDRILSNLIENAIKYSRPGDRVTLQAERTAEGRVRLAVLDTGPGIEPRHIPRLFERFYRADKGRGRDLGGTGLGLAIVKHLAEALEGRVTVESKVGQGSGFFVELSDGPTATTVAELTPLVPSAVGEEAVVG